MKVKYRGSSFGVDRLMMGEYISVLALNMEIPVLLMILAKIIFILLLIWGNVITKEFMINGKS